MPPPTEPQSDRPLSPHLGSTTLADLSRRVQGVLGDRQALGSPAAVEDVLVDISAHVLALETERRRLQRQLRVAGLLDDPAARRLPMRLSEVEVMLDDLQRLREPLQKRRDQLSSRRFGRL